MATLQQAIPPAYQIAKSGTTLLQASDAMAAWMQLITKQTAAAIAVLPAGTVTVSPGTDPTQPETSLPENAVIVGGAGLDNSNVEAIPVPVPDPGQPGDLVLTTAGPGQRPRWQHLSAIVPSGMASLTSTVAPELSPEQQRILDQIVALLYELIRSSRT